MYFTNLSKTLSKALKYSQDRLLEKKFISNLGISTAPFYQIKNYVDVKDAIEKLKGNAILKTRKFGYDGKGQHIIKKYRIPNIEDNIEKSKYIIEGIIKFKKEISIIVIIKKSRKSSYSPHSNKWSNMQGPVSEEKRLNPSSRVRDNLKHKRNPSTSSYERKNY